MKLKLSFRAKIALTAGASAVIGASALGFSAASAAPQDNNGADSPGLSAVVNPDDFPGISAEQRKALVEGVTAQSYRAAVNSTLGCLRAAGLQVQGPFNIDGAGSLGFTYTGGDKIDEGTAGKLGQKCQFENSIAVETAWSKLHSGSQSILNIPAEAVNPR